MGDFLEIEEVKEYLEAEIDKALSELKEDKNNVELYSRFRTLLEILEWIDINEREDHDKIFPTEGKQTG